MFQYFRQTFLEPRGTRWFGLGMVVESCSKPVGDRILARLREVLPHANFELLSKYERPNMYFLGTFQVKRPLGGLRLLVAARKRYDLVVLFATGEGQLSLCRALALLVMRPKMYFVFNEHGEGFWLNRQDWQEIRGHLEMRYRLRKRWNGFTAWLRKLQRGLVWLALLPIRMVKIFYAALLFLTALLLLAVLRTTYDTYYYRFRFFGKTAGAPRRTPGDREDSPSAAAVASERHTHDYVPPCQ